MATYSTGITVTWDSTAFVEVTELAWNYGGAQQGREVAWTNAPGNVSVTCLGTANCNINQFGQRKVLQITGGGATLNTYAIWESLAVAPERNGVTSYTVTFKIVDNV